MLFKNTVEAKTYELLKRISATEHFSCFYLAGGTALSLQIGHRISVDLDFFAPREFDPEQLISYLKDFGEFGEIEITNTAENTLQCFINDIKVDFLRHNYPMLNAIAVKEEIPLASIEDISAMKLNAVHNRGARKDFYDVYFLLKKYTLSQLLEFYHQKYPERNTLQLLKSLSYFEDAEDQPEATLLHYVSWEQLKSELNQAISKLLI